MLRLTNYVRDQAVRQNHFGVFQVSRNVFQRKILICRESRVRNSKAKRFRKRDERAVLHEPIRVEPKVRDV